MGDINPSKAVTISKEEMPCFPNALNADSTAEGTLARVWKSCPNPAIPIVSSLCTKGLDRFHVMFSETAHEILFILCRKRNDVKGK